MTVNELESRLSEFPLDSSITINYPNDDQSWSPSIVVWKDNQNIGEIEITPNQEGVTL